MILKTFLTLTFVVMCFLLIWVGADQRQNKEISTTDYDLLRVIVTCYPAAKKDILDALNSDNKITQVEYIKIMKKCNDYKETNSQSKEKLREIL